MNSRKCDICNVDVHRASYAKHLRSKYQLENEKQNELIIPKCLFKEPIDNKIEKLYNLKSLKQLARDNIKLDDKQLNKDLSKKMIKPYYFTDRESKVGFSITLENHDINHANSKLIVKPDYPKFRFEVRYNTKVIKEISIFNAKLINQNKSNII